MIGVILPGYVFREGAEERLYIAKKFIVTEVGSAFHEIMVQFEKSWDLAEKKRIGSDMTNITMGHMIRGQFCSALAAMILDGLRPYRLEGLVTDDIWKVTVAFCNEGKRSTPSIIALPLHLQELSRLGIYMYASTGSTFRQCYRGIWVGTPPNFQPVLSRSIGLWGCKFISLRLCNEVTSLTISYWTNIDKNAAHLYSRATSPYKTN